MTKGKEHSCKWCERGDFCVACQSVNVELKDTHKEKDGTVIQIFYCRDCGKTTGHAKSDWDLEKEALQYEAEVKRKSQRLLFEPEKRETENA